MPKIIKNGKEYSGVPIEVVTAWAPTADPVQVKEPLMGNTDISSIGDGTVTGAIDNVKTGLTTVSDNLSTLIKIKTISSGATSIERGYVSAPLDTPTGYTPLGILQYQGSGTGGFYLQELRISGSNAQAYVRSIAGSASSLTVTFTVLFIKTGYIS